MLQVLVLLKVLLRILNPSEIKLRRNFLHVKCSCSTKVFRDRNDTQRELDCSLSVSRSSLHAKVVSHFTDVYCVTANSTPEPSTEDLLDDNDMHIKLHLVQTLDEQANIQFRVTDANTLVKITVIRSHQLIDAGTEQADYTSSTYHLSQTTLQFQPFPSLSQLLLYLHIA
ncbi:hypothetical protein J6590_070289 [Homalodisca vitripennis]|nr:hypothetical protein J6590_070289 [Homalodisca vitripennis]